jgi:transglutaminase-like putative cysteine protease
MHAWAEVYLPGGGWKGFDPGSGIAVADQHVAVAAAADPEDASPTSGAFRGTDVHSKLEFDVSIKCSD